MSFDYTFLLTKDTKVAFIISFDVHAVESIKSEMIEIILAATKVFMGAATLGLLLLRVWFVRRRRIILKQHPNDTTLAFYHPQCSAGGGGERVLWKAIEGLGEMRNAGMKLRVNIYTVDQPRELYSEGEFVK